jgi:putative oxidoreductase
MMSPKVTYLVARFLIASVFVGFGAEHLLAAAQVLPGRALPSAPWMLLYAFEMLAGLAIMLGWQSGRLAFLMAAIIAVDAFAAHPFWKYQGPAQHDQMLHFLKNLSVIGGLLLVSWIESSRLEVLEPEADAGLSADPGASREEQGG